MTIRKEFEVHFLNSQGKDKAKELAEFFSAALSHIELICGTEGREISIVRTKLEEASFFAKKAMASRVENQEK